MNPFVLLIQTLLLNAITWNGVVTTATNFNKYEVATTENRNVFQEYMKSKEAHRRIKRQQLTYSPVEQNIGKPGPLGRRTILESLDTKYNGTADGKIHIWPILGIFLITCCCLYTVYKVLLACLRSKQENSRSRYLLTSELPLTSMSAEKIPNHYWQLEGNDLTENPPITNQYSFK